MSEHGFKDSKAAEIHRALGANIPRAQELFAGVSDEAFNLKPSAKGWSAAECIEHMVITHEIYLPKMQRAIAKAAASGKHGQPPYEWRGWFGRFIYKMISADNGKKTKAPPAFKPKASSDVRKVSEVLDRYRASVEALQAQVFAIDGLDLARVKIAPPILFFARFSIGQGFEIMEAHDRRHFAQATRAIATKG